MNNLIQYNDDWTSILSDLVLTLVKEHARVNVYQDGHYKSSGRLVQVESNDNYAYIRLGTLNANCLCYQFNIESIYSIQSSVTADGLKFDIETELGY